MTFLSGNAPNDAPRPAATASGTSAQMTAPTLKTIPTQHQPGNKNVIIVKEEENGFRLPTDSSSTLFLRGFRCDSQTGAVQTARKARGG